MINRTFTLDDQLAFARLSGDYNPIHVDPIASRRLMFGRVVVHGFNAICWAVDAWLAARPPAGQLRIEKLAVDFKSVMLIDDLVSLTFREDGGVVHFELTTQNRLAATIDLTPKPTAINGSAVTPMLWDDTPQQDAQRTAELHKAAGKLNLHLDTDLAAKLYPYATRYLAPADFATLLAMTRLVGMETPGRRLLCTGMNLAAAPQPAQTELAYNVTGYDERFSMMLNLAIRSPVLSGTLSTVMRALPTSQASIQELRTIVKPDEFKELRALVIGGSRGLGELATKQLAVGGADVRFTYRLGADDAKRVADEIQSAGGSAKAFVYAMPGDPSPLLKHLDGWKPNLLCYFATPPIPAMPAGQFSAEQFRIFCDCYVDGFQKTFDAVESLGELRAVFYPSSSVVEELPSNLAEYAAAKTAAETMCNALAKSRKQMQFFCPRLPRLATDQTSSVIETGAADPKPVILDLLRRIARREALVPPAAASPAKASAPEKEKPKGPSLAIAATFTAEPIETVLQFALGEIGWSDDIAFAPFNQVFQSLLDGGSGLNRADGAAVLLLRLQDLAETQHQMLSAGEWQKRLTPTIDELLSAVSSSPGRRAPLLVVLCPPSQEVWQNAAVAEVFRELESKLAAGLKAVSDVHVFQAETIASLYPVARIDDPDSDAMGQIPYTQEYFAALALFVARMAHAAKMKPYKAVVLDCDNTLWRGVCGEGGVDAVFVDPPFRALQEMAVAQIEKGRIICLNSKNVEQDVFDVFDRHAGMVLRREQVVAHRINWQPKSANLLEMARELNLGVDSFIFIDDNPIECAEVRANCPAALAVQLPEKPDDIPQFLRHLWPLDQLRVTDQDRQRTQSYLQNASREAVRKQSAGLDDFLAKLELKILIFPVDEKVLPRAAQLTERTNQFNLSTIRRSESQVKSLTGDPNHQCEVVDVKDRFGDYGIVGLMITRAESAALVVDTFLLSCRVLGRGVEHRMLARAGVQAKEKNLPTVRLPFVRTKKNLPILDFLTTVAKQFRSETADWFVFNIPTDYAATINAANFRLTEAPEESAKAATTELQGPPPLLYQKIATEWRDPAAVLDKVRKLQQRSRESLGDNSGSTGFIAPRDDRERKVADIFAKVLGIDRVGANDDYFALGGTSLLAVRVVLEIEKVFGRQVPIAMLIKSSTIAKLAASLGDPVEQDDGAVVTFIAEGANPPLFLLPGVGGHVMSYRRVTQLMGTQQPIYGLEMRPEDPINRTVRPMDEIARDFITRMRNIQPSGPYFMGGWSYGGAMVFEMARQLLAAGEKVSMVAMIDTYNHGFPRAVSRSERMKQHAKNLAGQTSLGGKMSYVNARLKMFAHMAHHKFMLFTGKRRSNFHQYGSDLIEDMVLAWDASWKQYRPRPLDVRISLVRGMDRPVRVGVSYDDPYNGWGPVALQGVDVYDVPCNHVGFFEEAFVDQTAAALAAAVRAALARDSVAATASH